MRVLLKETTLVCASGTAFGLFLVEAMRKIGVIHFWVIVLLPLVVLIGAVVFWRIWGKVLSGMIKKEEVVILKYDAVSFAPFFLTLLMFERKHLNIPSAGTFILIGTIAMSVWIKIFYAVALIKEKAKMSSWAFAVPIGFGGALLTQFLFSEFNLARFLVLGQVFALLWAGIISGKNFYTMRNEA